MKGVVSFSILFSILADSFGICLADPPSHRGDTIQIQPPEIWPQDSVAVALNDSAAVPGDVKSYFPFLLNMGMHYDLLEPTATGNKRIRYTVCIDKFYKDGELCGAIKNITFIGSIKTEALYVYAIGDNQVFLTMITTDLMGTTKYYVRPIILKIPSKKNQKVEWTYHHARDTSEVYKCSSEYIPSLSTKLGKLKDIVVVTKKTYLKGELYTFTEKEYYAKGYGLVRFETINDSGEVAGAEVVKRENYGP